MYTACSSGVHLSRPQPLGSTMAHQAAPAGSPSVTPLCVKEKRRTQVAGAVKGEGSGRRHGANGFQSGRGRERNDHIREDAVGNGDRRGTRLPCACRPRSPYAGNKRPAPIAIERSEIIRLASRYTPCAGCSAAVKGLLQRPLEELRLVNAVMEECEPEGGTCERGSGIKTGSVGANGNVKRPVNGSGNGARVSNGVVNDTFECGIHSRPRSNGVGDKAFECRPLIAAETIARPCGQRDSQEAQEEHDHEYEQIVHGSSGSGSGSSSSSSEVGVLPRVLRLREAYLTDRGRLDELLGTFPLESLMKKMQPKGVGLRCELHRRNGGQATAENWEWEDAWDRLPADLRLKVATIDVDVLEAAMHRATSTHRFCADCKHNVLTAFDILTYKCDPADMDNEDEFLPDLFWPFAGRIGPAPDDTTGHKVILSCPIEDVEELICWHEHFDSREYTRSSQRHAATLEHGQREIRSIVGSVLLSQLRTNYQNYLAQVQGEQYLFALVLHVIRARIEGSARSSGDGRFGSRGCATAVSGGPSACPGCGGAAERGCPICEGTGLSLSELGLVEDDKKTKTKSKKKRERKARAKAAKKSQHNGGNASTAAAATMLATACNGHGTNKLAAGGNAGRHTNSHEEPECPKANLGDAAGVEANGSGTLAKSQARAVSMASSPLKRSGSSGMEMVGSLLSMLSDANRRGREGTGHNEDDDDDGDDGIDEDLLKEMERLRIQKERTDVQRTRAALRSSLQKKFDQLLFASTAIAAREGGGNHGGRRS